MQKARCFWDGLGVESDKFKSGELFKEAAINENKMKTDAKLYYAYFLYITDKPQEFKKYIIEVANEGNITAQKNAEKDEEKARRFLLKAANRGHHNTIKT
ncbi:1300_t:CDS:2, partial [Gigaspora rosea]